MSLTNCKGFVRKHWLLSIAAVTLACVAAVVVVARAADEDPWSWTHSVGGWSGGEDIFSLADAEAEAELLTGEDVDVVGTAGAWGFVTAFGDGFTIPVDSFGGGEPPDVLTGNIWIILGTGAGSGGVDTFLTEVPLLLLRPGRRRRSLSEHGRAHGVLGQC